MLSIRTHSEPFCHFARQPPATVHFDDLSAHCSAASTWAAVMPATSHLPACR